MINMNRYEKAIKLSDADFKGTSKNPLGADFRANFSFWNGRVIMYADRETDSMKRAIAETNRRRQIQDAYNKRHGITPQSISKKVFDIIAATLTESKPKKTNPRKRRRIHERSRNKRNHSGIKRTNERRLRAVRLRKRGGFQG